MKFLLILCLSLIAVKNISASESHNRDQPMFDLVKQGFLKEANKKGSKINQSLWNSDYGQMGNVSADIVTVVLTDYSYYVGRMDSGGSYNPSEFSGLFEVFTAWRGSGRSSQGGSIRSYCHLEYRDETPHVSTLICDTKPQTLAH